MRVHRVVPSDHIEVRAGCVGPGIVSLDAITSCRRNWIVATSVPAANQLLASWRRAGSRDRALERPVFRAIVRRHGRLDPTIVILQ